MFYLGDNFVKLKRVVMAIFSIAVLIFLSACSDSKPLKIGFIGSLTGKRSDIGVAARNAVQLRIDEINKMGGVHGREVKLIVEDNRGNAGICEKKLKGFIDNGIKYVVGPLFSQMAEVAMRSTKGKDVFLMSPSMSTSLLSGKDDNIFRIAYPTSIQSILLADLLISQGHRKVGVVYDLSNKGYTEPLFLEFKKRIESNNIKIKLVERIDGDRIKEFSTLSRKVHGADLDVILMCLSATDAATLAQQLKNKGSGTKMYGVSWTQTNDLLKYGGRAVEGMFLISVFKHKKETVEHAEFNRKYIEKYGEKPSFICTLAYDSTNILLSVLGNSRDLTPGAVKEAILKKKVFKGLDATIFFDQYGDVSGNYSIVRVQDGSFVQVGSQ